ncbi:MAG: 30S ribosomal protein S12 methylthiotransferase RimO [Deltaproteobacteria bacterium]|jgi:ribosomal protein S12 methylthiotransferase|nr:30S ribosomal protein S12 methylthiotransferase RimO [Deltaproteobacteria bacterium]
MDLKASKVAQSQKKRIAQEKLDALGHVDGQEALKSPKPQTPQAPRKPPAPQKGQKDGQAGRSAPALAAQTVCLVSLGCPKNLVDSERLLGRCVDGLGLRPTAEPEQADLLLVNTCAFIQPAVEEAVETILDLAARRKPGARLVVAGCLAARYGASLSRELSEADLLLAPAEYGQFAEKVSVLLGRRPPDSSGGPWAASFEQWARRTATPSWRAWLKAAEGCDNRCAYCLIPAIRGPLRPRPLDELLAEAQALVASGVKELTLVAQDLTAWRGGLAGQARLAGGPKAQAGPKGPRGLAVRAEPAGDLALLARELAAVPGLRWLRLMYAYPERLAEKLVRALARIDGLTPYLDVPFQHASPNVLKRMGRGTGDALALTRRLRSWWPDLALRTTLMVGFPGETEEDFDQLVRLVEEGRFDQAGVFKFSPEEGARAAGFAGQLPAAVKEKRRRTLMARQRKVSLALNRARVGQRVEILVEGPAAETDLVMTGRASFQAPEVDGLIYFDGHQPRPGQLVQARLTGAGAYDLTACLEEFEGDAS